MLAVLIMTLFTGTAPAPAMMPGFLDAAKLVSICNASGPDAKSGRSICMGYVVGVVDQLMAGQARGDDAREAICPPKPVTVTDAVAAVVKYSRFATTARGIGAASFVRFAMEETYPCQVRGRGQ
jgi:predicted RecA/RadA family phage recombinase